MADGVVVYFAHHFNVALVRRVVCQVYHGNIVCLVYLKVFVEHLSEILGVSGLFEQPYQFELLCHRERVFGLAQYGVSSRRLDISHCRIVVYEKGVHWVFIRRILKIVFYNFNGFVAVAHFPLVF